MTAPRGASDSKSRILAHDVADQVRQLIERGVYAAGAPLRQEDIAARLGVSRIPIREAFRLLEADGLVTVHANRGAFVARPGAEEVAELFEVRQMLEADLLRRACRTLSAADLDHVDWLDSRIALARNAQEWVLFDEQFHAAIYAAARRPRTLALVTTLRRSLNSYYVRYLGPDAAGRKWKGDHRRLRRALRRRNETAAARVLEKHLGRTRALLLAALERESPRSPTSSRRYRTSSVPARRGADPSRGRRL
jgi:DNA-binding GntR family transcriptional regulator